MVIAKGDVVIVNPDGTAEFARELTLDKDLSAGVALGFSARLADNVKLAADSLIRRNQDVTELNQAIYTPCDICAKNGNPKAPTWSISASKAVEDKKKHVVYYRNAVIHVLGVPVFYAPVFWHADADAVARSGLLAPQVIISKKRGYSYQQPYLLVLSPWQDVEISPIFHQGQSVPQHRLAHAVLLRRHRRAGRLHYEREFDNSGNAIPGTALTSRGYVLANGAFRPRQQVEVGFSAERVTDDLLFDRYDIQGVYERRGCSRPTRDGCCHRSTRSAKISSPICRSQLSTSRACGSATSSPSFPSSRP